MRTEAKSMHFFLVRDGQEPVDYVSDGKTALAETDHLFITREQAEEWVRQRPATD